MTWYGPDLYTLRGWVELELALDSGARVDAAHAVLSDGIQGAFGPRVFERIGEALADEGRDPDDLAVLLADDDLAGRVLTRLHEPTGEQDEAPDTDLVWSSVSEAGGRDAFQRAKRRRAVNARLAEVLPRRRRIAGERPVRA